jgi:SNF2 family DNA or RNA helicase
VVAEQVEPAAPGLYHSPLGLFGFQIDGAAHTYWQWTQNPAGPRAILALWDTGIGKSHLAMATASMLVEDDLVDKVLIVAEANKVMDWSEDDFPTFTDLGVRRYSGDPKRREKILGGDDQVLVMSYETGRNDICTFKPKSHAVTGTKMLTEALEGQRVAICFDEFSRLRSRSANLYVAWDFLVNRRLRKTAHEPYLLGLTATTVEKWPIDHWNAGRLIAPSLAGTVADFEANYIKSRDMHENPSEFKNITPRETEPGVIPLNRMFESITLRKRKTDPDVIDHFPAKMENGPTMVEITGEHRALYDQVEEIFADETLDDNVARQGFGLLRQIVGHPMSLLRSQGEYAREIVAAVGPGYLERISQKTAKVEAMLEWQARMANQQTVIFTFYGGSILPHLERALTGAGYTVSVNHGSLSVEERKRQQDAYKGGATQIFLSSDAGAKGLNLGVGTGLLHYETPLLYSTFDQRSNRIHRIDSKHASVTIDHLIVKDSIEVGVTRKMLKRNQWAEAIQDPDLVDDHEPTERFLRARDRLEMLRRAA